MTRHAAASDTCAVTRLTSRGAPLPPTTDMNRQPPRNCERPTAGALSAPRVMTMPSSSPLPTAPTSATVALRKKMAALRVLPVLKRTESPVAARVSGKAFQVRPNDQGARTVSFAFTGDRVDYRLTDERGTHRIVAGLADWIEQDTTMTGARIHHEYEPDQMRVVAGAEWRDATTLVMTWCFVEAAFRDTVVCRFSDQGVTIDRSVNMNMEDRVLPTLSGTRA